MAQLSNVKSGDFGTPVVVLNNKSALVPTRFVSLFIELLSPLKHMTSMVFIASVTITHCINRMWQHLDPKAND